MGSPRPERFSVVTIASKRLQSHDPITIRPRRSNLVAISSASFQRRARSSVDGWRSAREGVGRPMPAPVAAR